MRVDDSRIRKEKVADSKISGRDFVCFLVLTFIHVLHNHEIFRRQALPIGSEMLLDVPLVTIATYYGWDFRKKLSSDLHWQVS